MFGNLDEEFIEQRRVDLQNYLHSLMMQRPVLESKALADFFQPPVCGELHRVFIPLPYFSLSISFVY